MSTIDKIPTTELYFESHITFEPREKTDVELKLSDLEETAAKFGFKIANFAMYKPDAPEPKKFCSTRSKDYTDILKRTMTMYSHLGAIGYKVTRYKIENTLLDVKCTYKDYHPT